VPRVPDTDRPGRRKDDGEKRRRPFPPGRGRDSPSFVPKTEGPVRRKKPKIDYETRRPQYTARPPMDNEIPDSANVQNSAAPGADLPSSVDANPETRQAQLNLG